MTRNPETTLLWRNGRRAKCRSCNQPPHGGHIRRYDSTPSPDGPSLAELGMGVAVLLVWFVAIFWALPILATAVMR